jgi:hypothetical protein
VAYIRTVKTASRATAVQIVHSNRRGSREIEHIGSAHTPEDVSQPKPLAKSISTPRGRELIKVGTSFQALKEIQAFHNLRLEGSSLL